MSRIGGRFLIALVPIGFLLVLLALFSFSINQYIQCEPQACAQCAEKTCEQCSAENCRKDGDAINCESMLCALESIILEKEQDAVPDKFKKQEINVLRFNARTIFVFLANLYFLVCLLAAGASLYIIYKSLKDGVFYPLKKDTIYALAVTAIFAGVTALTAMLLYEYSNLYMRVFNFFLARRGISADLPQAQWILKFVNSFGFAVCIMLYLTISAILFSPLKRTNPEGLLEASQKMKYLRTILYLGTLILVIGMLLIRSLHQWTMVFMLRTEGTVKIAENFFSNLLALDGGFYTLILAAAYLPAALIIRWQVEKVNGLPLADTEREKELQKYHLTFSLSESLPKIIAILGPILAGPIGELFTKLIK